MLLALEKIGYKFYWNRFQDTQRTLAVRKYYKILFCLHIDISLMLCMCIWITWNSYKQILKRFNRCLFVLKIIYCSKIVYFVPMKLLNHKVLCGSKLSLLNPIQVCLIEKYCWNIVDYCLFITEHCWMLTIHVCI